MKLLHVNASPRGSDSNSLGLSEHFLRELRKHRSVELDRFNLFSGSLPEFGDAAAGAKMAVFRGAEATPAQKQAWASSRAVFERLAAADAYLFNVPLWNNGLPYILKQFIDIVTQPGWAFGFDMEKGYTGLLTGKKAVLIHSSGVYHEGIPAAFGSDFSTPYLTDWLQFIGVKDIHQIHFAPTVVNPRLDSTKSRVEKEASQIAALF